MLKILVQTVFSLIVISSLSIARNIPLVKNIDIYIPYKEFSVIEFPFKIKGYAFTPFVYSVKLSNKDNKLGLSATYSTPSLQKKASSMPEKVRNAVNRKMKAKKKSTPIDVAKGNNFFRFYPKKIGKTELLVWGYKKFPVMIKLHITKDPTKYNRQIKFLDYSIDEAKAKRFESASHDRVIIKITKALFLNTLPRGYRNIALDNEYISGNLDVKLIKTILGRRYKGEEYILKNKSSNTITLVPEMFEGKGIYGVTFLNNILVPKSSARVFIVREK